MFTPRSQNKAMFIGAFFLLLGLSIILKAVFKIDLPVFRVLLALFLIWLGVKLLFNTGEHPFAWKAEPFKDKHTAVFTEGDFRWNSNGEKHSAYSVVFGDAKVDLTEAAGPDPVDVSTVFGNMDVFLDAKKLTLVRANSVFGEISMPDGQTVNFGSMQARSPDQSGEPKLKIHAHCVFGGIRFHYRTPEKTPENKPSGANPADKADT
jgi:predicted membrane protein